MEKDMYLNLPIQLFAAIDRDGKVTPIKFRYQDKSGEIFTIHVDEVISYKATSVGININAYCELDDRRRLFLLSYSYYDHCWKIGWIKN